MIHNYLHLNHKIVKKEVIRKTSKVIKIQMKINKFKMNQNVKIFKPKI